MIFGTVGRKTNPAEKCPVCRRVDVPFMDLGEGVLGCYDCGCAFVAKRSRVKVGINPSVKEFIDSQTVAAPVVPMEVGIPGREPDPPIPEATTELSGHTCHICGKTFKNKIGLAGHSRSHKDAA
jgi:hypothetical protein